VESGAEGEEEGWSMSECIEPVRFTDGMKSNAAFYGSPAGSLDGLDDNFLIKHMIARVLHEILKQDSSLRRVTECEADYTMLAMSTCGNIKWVQSGMPRIVLGDSMAALLTATRAPGFNALPYMHFVIEIPRRFLPVDMDAPDNWPTWVHVSRFDHGEGVCSMYVEAGSSFLSERHPRVIASFREDDLLAEDVKATQIKEVGERAKYFTDADLQRVMRLVGNVSAYVSQYRECVTRRNPVSSVDRVFDVRAPRDIVIDRDFRDRVASLASSRTMAAARQALRHIVRGHWKMQAHGQKLSERSMKWIAPYLRGREDLGRVIEKTVRLDA
jgi:hypothetical protein